MRNRAQSADQLRLRKLARVGVVVLCVMAFRLIQFQVVEAGQLREDSYSKRAVETTIPALRGKILDSAGNVLAESVNYFDVNIDPSMVGPFSRKGANSGIEITVEQARDELAQVLKLDAADIESKFKISGRYANLKKSVDPATYRALKALDIPWLFYDPKPQRIYPNGAVAGNILGFVGDNGEPLEGLELSMNACLAGQDGKEVYEKGVDGIKIPASTQTIKPAVNGQDLILTINTDLQYYAQQVMAKYVQKQQAEWGTAIVVEVKTGKILAAAEAPSVDPNVYWKADDADRRSRIFQAVFEPGSTLKTVTAATLVDQGKATPTSQVVAPYRLKVLGNLQIQDSHKHEDQKLTLTGVLAESSNTGIVQLGNAVDAQTRFSYYKAFGLGQKTSVNFPGESAGILHKPNAIDELSKLNEMFGQAMSVTPIQTAMLYQTIANSGVRLAPVLVSGCKAASGTLVSSPVAAPVKVLSAKAARTTIDMLENVVKKGAIGRTAKIAGYRIAGKTGTAEIKEGTTYGKRYAISFIGMTPAETPEYVLAVTLFKPKTVTNSLGATPPWKEIMNQVLNMYRVPPSTTPYPRINTTW